MTPDVAQWLARWPSPLTPALAAERIAAIQIETAAGDGLHFLVERLQDDQAVGWVSVRRNGDEPRRAAVGYWVGTAYQRHGFATEATEAAVAKAFATLDVDVIEAGAQPANEGSFRVMAALGMRPAGQRLVFAESRRRNELCEFWEVARDHFSRGSRTAEP